MCAQTLINSYSFVYRYPGPAEISHRAERFFIVQYYCARGFSVTTCTTGLLEIIFRAQRYVPVYYQTYIGFVYTHTEGVGGHHYLFFPAHPFLQGFGAYSRANPAWYCAGVIPFLPSILATDSMSARVPQ